MLTDIVHDPVGYDVNVWKNKAYVPSDCAVVDALYVVPEGLVSTPFTIVLGCPVPVTWIVAPLV